MTIPENTIDYKLGRIVGIIDALQKSHEDEKKIHEEDRNIRNANRDRIEEISHAMVEMKDLYLRIDSWKNGQTLFMNKTMEDIKKIDDKTEAVGIKLESYKIKIDEEIRPLKNDLESRKKLEAEGVTRRTSLFYDVLKWFILLFLVGVIANFRAIWNSIINSLN